MVDALGVLAEYGEFLLVSSLLLAALALSAGDLRLRRWRQDRFAKRRGLDRVPGFPPQLKEAGFRFFTHTSQPGVKSCLRGQEGECQVILFDCTYVARRWSRNDRRVTMCMVQVPGQLLGDFSLAGRRFWYNHNEAAPEGERQVFEEDPAFSRGLVLHGQDPATVRAHFHPELRKALMEYSSSDLYLEARGGWMLFHFRKRLGTGDLQEFLDRALTLRRLLSPPQQPSAPDAP